MISRCRTGLFALGLSCAFISTGIAESIQTPLAWPSGFVQVGADGFSIQSANGDNQLRFNALIQTDQDIFMNTQGVTINNGVYSKPIIDSNTVDRIWMRRARPILSGTLLKYTDFLIIPDFGQGQTRLYDGFADVHYFDELSFRVGKQISPMTGMDILRPPGYLFMMEAGYPSMMAPNREIGFLFYGHLNAPGTPAKPFERYNFGFNDWFFYQIGVFSGTADDSNPGLNPVSSTGFSTEGASLENKAVELRVFSNPFQGSSITYLEGLGLGLASGFDNPNDQANLPALLSVGQNPIFTYTSTIAANGHRWRIHPQIYWFSGPFGVMGDWAQTTQNLSSEVEPNTTGQTNTYVTQKNRAGEIQVSYNITGEKNHFINKVTPNKPFSPSSKGAWGALQLVGRWSGLYVDANVFNAYSTSGGQTTYLFSDPRTSIQQANTWSIGFNWFLNQNLQMTTEYDQTRFMGGCSTGAMSAAINPGCLTSGLAATASSSQVINRPDEKVIMQRFQLQF